MKILIDNGHGCNTAGKASPDGSLREYAYTREIARRLHDKLNSNGYDSTLIVTEETDVPLGERCRRVNRYCTEYGAKNCLFVSIHVNAAASGRWANAGGWSCYTSPGKTNADALAECLYDAAETELKHYAVMMEQGKMIGEYSAKQKAIRMDKSDGDKDIEENFYVLKHTVCPAVLTENLFMDNQMDVRFLKFEEGKNAIVNIHYRGIVNYLKK